MPLFGKNKTEEDEQSICDDCDAYPEDTLVVYNQNCSKGRLTLEKNHL